MHHRGNEEPGTGASLAARSVMHEVQRARRARQRLPRPGMLLVAEDGSCVPAAWAGGRRGRCEGPVVLARCGAPRLSPAAHPGEGPRAWGKPKSSETGGSESSKAGGSEPGRRLVAITAFSPGMRQPRPRPCVTGPGTFGAGERSPKRSSAPSPPGVMSWLARGRSAWSEHFPARGPCQLLPRGRLGAGAAARTPPGCDSPSQPHHPTGAAGPAAAGGRARPLVLPRHLHPRHHLRGFSI